MGIYYSGSTIGYEHSGDHKREVKLTCMQVL
jgi:hypothetical protein